MAADKQKMIEIFKILLVATTGSLLLFGAGANATGRLGTCPRARRVPTSRPELLDVLPQVLFQFLKYATYVMQPVSCCRRFCWKPRTENFVVGHGRSEGPTNHLRVMNQAVLRNSSRMIL